MIQAVNPPLSEDNGLRVWPKDWPQYKQVCFGSFEDRCDMLVGPCACGAWHEKDEFELKAGTLYRYNEPVREQDVRYNA